MKKIKYMIRHSIGGWKKQRKSFQPAASCQTCRNPCNSCYDDFYEEDQWNKKPVKATKRDNVPLGTQEAPGEDLDLKEVPGNVLKHELETIQQFL